MPAAAVTPAPIAYIKVAAVKKLVVGSACLDAGPPVGLVLVSGTESLVFPYSLPSAETANNLDA